jgi:predicted flap endonuclease-1-like 5' DNA nuclease
MSIPTDNDADLWCDSDDPDDDNDGWFDTDENDCGTDSLDYTSVPGDADGDGLCDSLEVVIPDVDDGGFPWWLCFLFLIAIIIILPLILRSINDAEPENTTVMPEVVGTGLLEDPFILTAVEGIDPGEIVLSEETITITNMSSEMKVHIIDLNKSENGRRFLMVDEVISEEGVAMIVASDDGDMNFRLSFDDSADPSLAGGTYDSMLKVGRNSVHFKWNVTVETDPDYVKDVDETLDDDDADDDIQLDSEESEKDAKKAEKAEAKAKKAEKAEAKAAKAEIKKAEASEAEAKAAKAEIKKAEASMSKEEKKVAGLERVKANAAKIDFAAIGVATMDDRDDLKVIKGIGPFLEEKLNALGIYTFKQISKMSSELEDQVNIAIEFFPGRVKRDQWVDQCKAILNDD